MHVSRVSRAVTQADVGVRMGATHRKPSFERDAYVQAVVAAGVAGVKVEQLAHATSKLLLVLELWQVGQDEGADFVAIGEPGRKLLARARTHVPRTKQQSGSGEFTPTAQATWQAPRTHVGDCTDATRARVEGVQKMLRAVPVKEAVCRGHGKRSEPFLIVRWRRWRLGERRLEPIFTRLR